MIITITLALNPAMSNGLNTPRNTVVLKLSNDAAINLATETFVNENPDSIVITYGTWKAAYTLSSVIVNLVIIGHGFDEGVQIQNNIVSWSNYGRMINGINSLNTVLLNCQSSKVVGVNKVNVFTFPSSVDARVGSFLASYVVNRNNINFDLNNAFDKIVNVLYEIFTGNLLEENLGVFGGSEAVYYIMTIITMLIAALVAEGLQYNGAVQAGAQKWALNFAIYHPLIITSLVGLWQGSVSVWTFTSDVMAFIDDTFFGGPINTVGVGVLEMIYNEAGILDIIVGVLLIGGTILAGFLTGSTWFYVRLVGWIALFSLLGYQIYKDAEDCDTLVGQYNDCSPPPPPPPPGTCTGNYCYE